MLAFLMFWFYSFMKQSWRWYLSGDSLLFFILTTFFVLVIMSLFVLYLWHDWRNERQRLEIHTNDREMILSKIDKKICAVSLSEISEIAFVRRGRKAPRDEWKILLTRGNYNDRLPSLYIKDLAGTYLVKGMRLDYRDYIALRRYLKQCKKDFLDPYGAVMGI